MGFIVEDLFVILIFEITFQNIKGIYTKTI